MPKKSTVEVPPLPPRGDAVPAYRWLCDALRAAILDGHFRPGARLPATRAVAARYGLARGTVVGAYEQLRAEGYVEGTVGSGTYVSAVLPDDLLHVARPGDRRGAARGASHGTPRGAPRAAPPRPPARHLSRVARRVRPFPTGAWRARAFRANQPALDLFPTALWAQVASRRLRMATAHSLHGGDALGYEPLREAIAEYAHTARGVRCTAAQVVVVSGVQEALDLLGRVLLDPGDRVCMEDPGYVGATLAFEALGARIAPVAVDAQGMRVPPARLRGVRLAYVTPAHQFPLGVTMTLPRRLELLEWARTAGALLVEDDHDGEYRYAGRPIPALQGLDGHGVVVFLGSFSKVLFPSLRLGYVILPPDLVDVVAATKSVANRHAPVLDQAVLADFIGAGHFGRHVRRMREVYAERLGVLLDEAGKRLAGLLEITGVEAGLQTAGWLPAGIAGPAAAQAAAGRGIDAVPLSTYALRAPARDGLQLGFAAVDPAAIRRGVRELAIALESLAGTSRRT